MENKRNYGIDTLRIVSMPINNDYALIYIWRNNK